MLHFPEGVTAKLISVNTRGENIGEEKRPALDMRFQIEAGNEVLALLDPNLPAHFYESKQGQLDGVPRVADKADLKFPHLDPSAKWDEDSEGYTLTIDHGIGNKSLITFEGCRVHKIAWTAMTGGTVELLFTASCVYDLTVAKVGSMGMKVQQDVVLQLAPPGVGA